MATNILGHADKRRYNPARDIAYCWPNIMKSAMDRVSKGSATPWLIKRAIDNRITDEQLIKVAQSLASYMAMCNKPEDSPVGVYDTMEKSGLFGCDDAAKMLVYAALGETMMAAFHSAIRDVLVEDEPSPLNDKRLADLILSSMDEVIAKRRSVFERVVNWFRCVFTK